MGQSDFHYDNNNQYKQKENIAKTSEYLGLIFQLTGAASGAIGAYYSAKSAQYELDSQSATQQFQADMADINQQRAMFQAETIADSALKNIMMMTMQYGQAKAAARASLGARNIQAGYGSAAELVASNTVMKEIDYITMNTNAVLARNKAMTDAVNYENQGSLLSASSKNLSSSSNAMSPVSNTVTSLIGSAGRVAYGQSSTTSPLTSAIKSVSNWVNR